MSDVETPIRLVWNADRRFTSKAFEDIAPRSVGYLIKGVFPLRGLAFIVGASKAGKTFVAIDWTAKLASGARTVMGRKAKQTGVAYIGAEDPDGIELRVHAWKVKNPRGSYTPFRLVNRAVNLLDPNEVEELIVELREIQATFEANDHRLGVIVFDTMSRCLPGAEENSSEGMSRAIGVLEGIGREFDALSLVVAHHGKGGEEKGIRGWSGMDAASDATVTVTRDKENPTQRSIELSKVKNGKDGDVFGFTLQPVPCGIYDEDGDEAWSMVVQYEAGEVKTSPKKRKALSPPAEIVLSSIHALIGKGICQKPPVTTEYAVTERDKAVRRGDLSLEAMDRGLSFDGEKPAAFRQRFGRAVSELAAAKRIVVTGDAIWPI